MGMVTGRLVTNLRCTHRQALECQMNRLVTILLTGGAGERLAPLTHDPPKPMMPFGGSYRLIDITLSSCINSGMSRIYVLIQVCIRE
jgi:ADP-glucose pyrophosphorylase